METEGRWMGGSSGILGRLGALRAVFEALGRPGAVLGPSRVLLGASSGPLRAVMGASWGPLGALLAVLGVHLAVLGLSWAFVDPSWAILGPSGDDFGDLCGRRGRC